MISISLYFYATEIERKLVTVTWNEIEASTIPKEFHNKNIAVFRCAFRARIHTETTRKFVEKMNALRPDVVVFTGDLIDKFGSYKAEREEAKGILQKYMRP